MKRMLLGALVLSGFAVFPQLVSAHSLETNFRRLEGTLETESVFSNGEVFPNAPVTVYSPEDPNTPFLEGRTDENGKFVFEPDPAIEGEWSVEIGEDSHWDALSVPVRDRNIDFEQISKVPTDTSHQHFISVAVGLFTLLSGVGITLFERRSR
ncbi:MAG: hypothetical protein AAGG02_02215 [Cyanobacteria bacterium P01_H01_bin.15]